MKIKNTASGPQTFGQVFKQGDFPTGKTIKGMQVDVKNRYADGSVKYAVLSAIFPAALTDYELLIVDAAPEQAPAAPWPADFAAAVKLTVDGVVYGASAAQNEVRKWLDGPVVTENQSMMIPMAEDGTKHPHLACRFGIRDYHGSSKRIELAVENCWAYEPGPRNFSYDIEITIAGVVIHNEIVTHYHHTRAAWVFWHGDAAQGVVQHDAQYLIKTKAVSNYITPPSEATLQISGALALNAGPMKIGPITGYMPNTGGRGDIGLLPDWAVSWLLSGDKRARDCSLAAADGAGSFSMHYRDQKTDRPVSLLDFPYMTIDGRDTDTYNPVTHQREAFPAPGGDISTPYTHDKAHQPEMAYLAYLLTGEYRYLEELQFWASYNSFSANPQNRQWAKGLVIDEQVRGQAWCLRTLVRTAAFTPDDDTLKPYFMGMANNNLDWYNATYSNNPAANNLGIITNGYWQHDGDTQVAPWMDDFFTSAVGVAVDLGFENAMLLLVWKSKFAVGRMTAPGFCWITAASYDITVRDSASTPIYDTFAQCAQHDYGPAFMALPCAGPEMAVEWAKRAMYPTSGGPYAGDMSNIADGCMGYPSNLQPALSYAAQYDVPNGKTAWTTFMSRTVKPDYSLGGMFDVQPLLESLTPPPEGNTMTFQITISGFDSAPQQLSPGAEASLTSIRVRIMSPDGATVLAESATLPLVLGSLEAGKYPLEIAALDSKGTVMGTPATGIKDTAEAAPLPQSVTVSLPSAITASVIQES